jgi:hypothetical protein
VGVNSQTSGSGSGSESTHLVHRRFFFGTPFLPALRILSRNTRLVRLRLALSTRLGIRPLQPGLFPLPVVPAEDRREEVEHLEPFRIGSRGGQERDQDVVDQSAVDVVVRRVFPETAERFCQVFVVHHS